MTTRTFMLPDLGEGLTEAALVRWMVAVGDTVAIDQPIAEVETAKSIVELPSPYAGVVVQLHGAEGEALQTGAPVIEVGDDRSAESGRRPGPESAPESERSAESAGSVARKPEDEHEAYRTEERAGSGNVLIGYGTGRGPAKGRRRRARSGPGAPPAAGAVAPSALADAGARRTVAVRSPIVRRLARDLGVDPRRVQPSGADGAVTRADVLRAAASCPALGRVSCPAGAAASGPAGTAPPAARSTSAR
ncbi:biotin/lipoyl-containing protein, partial [Leucobacter chromiiresistens]